MLAKMGRFEVAARIMAEAIPALESTGLPKALGFYFSGLGEAKLMTGELAAARVHFEKALALYREAGTESAALSILVMLTDITWALGDLDAALAAVVEIGRKIAQLTVGEEMELRNSSHQPRGGAHRA